MKLTSYSEFQSYIVPQAMKIGYFPSALPEGVRAAFMSSLYQACLNPRHDWEAESTMLDKWGELNLDFKYLTSSVIKLMRSYEEIDDLNEKGVENIRALCYKPIDGCLNGLEFSVAEMLDGFLSPESGKEIIPKISCAKNFVEGGGLCTCRFMEVPKETTSEDPEFLAWMREKLRSTRRP
ncbi:hypothetical protein [Alloalcanivorax xenomutans]|uniref:hypothetical protein n=1 Tax=Alloalcanivorax xenomutans TaxID=1094342 RepID=UPI0024E1D7B2|nr:hypothetical protein [Alloalcanivorax xenomutans]